MCRNQCPDNSEITVRMFSKTVSVCVRNMQSIQELVFNHIIKQKPTLIGEHDDSSYMVYFCQDYTAPIIYFPIKAKQSIPSQAGFMARIIGVLTFASNVPLNNTSTFVIKVAALAIPFNYNAG